MWTDIGVDGSIAGPDFAQGPDVAQFDQTSSTNRCQEGRSREHGGVSSCACSCRIKKSIVYNCRRASLNTNRYLE